MMIDGDGFIRRVKNLLIRRPRLQLAHRFAGTAFGFSCASLKIFPAAFSLIRSLSVVGPLLLAGSKVMAAATLCSRRVRRPPPLRVASRRSKVKCGLFHSPFTASSPMRIANMALQTGLPEIVFWCRFVSAVVVSVGLLWQ
jgi:hypothetical protein